MELFVWHKKKADFTTRLKDDIDVTYHYWTGVEVDNEFHYLFLFHRVPEQGKKEKGRNLWKFGWYYEYYDIWDTVMVSELHGSGWNEYMNWKIGL